MEEAVNLWSPVIITGRIPARRHLATAKGASFRGGSIKAAKPTKQTAKKPEEKPAKQASARKTEAEKLASAVPGQVKPEAAKEPVVKKEVTPNGVTYTTGQIPITVVQPPKSAKRSQVPIYTLEREPVPLTREAPADQLDDDFEFEFIDIDS